MECVGGETQMTSYEALADAAFSAAVNIEHYLEDQSRPLNKLELFSKMLAEPLNSNSQYKLLYDARILPLYRSAWSELKGSANQKKNGDTILAEISDFINNAKIEIERSKAKNHAKQVARFCLLMNRVFLEENASAYESSFRSRGGKCSRWNGPPLIESGSSKYSFER